jgi:hypothetical protein
MITIEHQLSEVLNYSYSIQVSIKVGLIAAVIFRFNEITLSNNCPCTYGPNPTMFGPRIAESGNLNIASVQAACLRPLVRGSRQYR